MSSSRLNEIRSKLRDSIRTETNKTIDGLNSTTSDTNPPPQANPQAGSCVKCSEPLAGEVKFCPSCGALQSGEATPRLMSTRSVVSAPSSAIEQNTRTASASALRNNLVSDDIPNLPLRQGCKALCIGMGDYDGLNNALPWPHKDAEDMARVLNGLGYQVKTIINQNFHETLSQLGTFIQSIEPGDDIVYTYSGHGCGIDAVPNLTALDTKSYDTLINVYRMMIETAKNQGARSVVIAIDACRHNNYEFAQYPWDGQQEALTATASKTAKFKRPEDEFGFAIIYGTSHDTSAYDSPFIQGIQNGMFTYFLKSELSRPGQSLSEVFKRVQKGVMDLSLSLDQFQKPALTNELSGEYYFYPMR
jgi:hypothetical protein